MMSDYALIFRAVYSYRMCGELNTTERVREFDADGFLSGAINSPGSGLFDEFPMHKKHQRADGRFSILNWSGWNRKEQSPLHRRPNLSRPRHPSDQERCEGDTFLEYTS